MQQAYMIHMYIYIYIYTLEEGPPLGNVFLLDLAFDVGFLVHRRLHSATIFREIYAKIALKSSIWGHMCIILVTLGVHWGMLGSFWAFRGALFTDVKHEKLKSTAQVPKFSKKDSQGVPQNGIFQ